MKTKVLILLAAVLLLSACDLGGNGSNTTTTATPAPVTKWGNMVRAADTYTYAPLPATLDDFIASGQIAATPDAACIVLWTTATSAYAGCRNTADDGQWPADCVANADTTVSCGSVGSVSLYFLLAMGPSRTITVAEAELADEIRRQTYCRAPRLDGSSNPCTIL